MLASFSSYSTRTLARYFHRWLEDPPSIPKFNQAGQEVAYLLVDGLWFGRWYVLMVYRQSRNLTILHISVAGKEVSTKIGRDLAHLGERGYRFTGVVSDGGTGIVRAINEVLSHIPHQICLAHMHRRIVAALGRHPQDHRVRQLKGLADHLWLIESKAALSWWQRQLETWVATHQDFLREYRRDDRGKWWYIHKGVRKATRLLKVVPLISFTFLNHPLMPKTTNELEAQFGHLAKRWLAHRGLKKDRWENFLRWFVYFYNQEKLAHNKRKSA